MRILIPLIVALAMSHSVFAQTFEIQYESLYDGTLYHNQLHLEDSFSVWELIPDPQLADKADELLVKDYAARSVYLTDYIFQKKLHVSDSLHPMQWTLQADTKHILGHLCYTAHTFFRGRSYIAYYTTDMPVSGGPWKFGGLPGVILEAVSADGNYRFLATHIQPDESVDLSSYELYRKELLSWNEYCQKTIHTIQQYVRYMQTLNNNPGSQVSLLIERPEIIYPLAQSGSGISSESFQKHP